MSAHRTRPRWIPVLAAALAFLPLARPDQSRAGTAPIPWRTDYERARAEASARDRPLWIQFTGPWCVYCRILERDTFTQPEVIALSRDDYIPVKIRTDERPDLVQSFGVSRLPATVVVGPDGVIHNRREGYADTGTFLGFLLVSRPPREGQGDRAPSLALGGNDPVNLVKGHGLKAGAEELTLRHDGQEFRFLDADDRDAFEKEPEKYVPTYRGLCVVNLVDQGAAVAGDPRYGVYYRDRLYLCADADSRQRFAADPSRYADADLADAGHCPHCRTESGLLVRGLPEFSAIHQGRRYLFPDPTHREAFRAAPDRFLR